MTDILHKIVADKRAEVEAMKVEAPLDTFRDKINPEVGLDFREALAGPDGVKIIAEIKRGSPSKGILSTEFNPAVLAARYRDGGAAALSVLTERNYFFGHYEFVNMAKKTARVPVLCKDFVFDQYQIYHAKLIGADAILLIVRLLTYDVLRDFLHRAKNIGLDCLVETHTREEVRTAIDCGADIIGVNNRDLADFTVRLETAEELAPLIPESVIKVAESGINTSDDIARLQRSGYRAFLVGEALVTSGDPVGLLKSLRGV